MNVEIEKARKIMENFDRLPAGDIKNFFYYLMRAINKKIASYDGLRDIDRDFLIINENQIFPKEIGEMYFFLKSMYLKEFKKADRDVVVVKGWKNNFYIKKTYFNTILVEVKNMLESL